MHEEMPIPRRDIPDPVKDDYEDEQFDIRRAATNGDRFGTVEDPIQAAQDMAIDKASFEELQDMYRYEVATLTDDSEERIVEKLKNLGMTNPQIKELRTPSN